VCSEAGTAGTWAVLQLGGADWGWALREALAHTQRYVCLCAQLIAVCAVVVDDIDVLWHVKILCIV
jgi:hypothetical protein